MWHVAAQVCDSFDAAANAVWKVAHEPGGGNLNGVDEVEARTVARGCTSSLLGGKSS